MGSSETANSCGEPLSMTRSDGQDFVWRFRLDEVPPDAVFDDPLLELIRVQWEELLKLCVPYDGDQPVRVDGFALMRDPDVINAIYRDDPRVDAA